MIIQILGNTSVAGEQVLADEVRDLALSEGHTVYVDAGTVALDQQRKDLLIGRSADVIVILPALLVDDIQGILDCYGETSARYVYCSSYEAYRAFGHWSGELLGDTELVPLEEDDPLRQKSTWAISEALVSAKSISATVLRLPKLYGPGLPNDEIKLYLTRMDSSTPVIVIAEDLAQWRSPIGYIEDIAQAIALAAQNTHAAGKVYNVADLIAFAHIDWIKAIGRAAEWEGRTETSATTDGSSTKNYDQHLIIDSTKIRQELGFGNEVPINEALNETVEWIRELGSTEPAQL